jgi:hypothetical protein
LKNTPNIRKIADEAINDAAVNYATAEQGEKADSAVQPEDLADVAISGEYEDLNNLPNIQAIAVDAVEELERQGTPRPMTRDEVRSVIDRVFNPFVPRPMNECDREQLRTDIANILRN